MQHVPYGRQPVSFEKHVEATNLSPATCLCCRCAYRSIDYPTVGGGTGHANIEVKSANLQTPAVSGSWLVLLQPQVIRIM